MTTPHQRAEAELTAYGLTLPETEVGLAWAFNRVVRVRGKMFVIFSDKAQAKDELTVIVKLPISFEMVQDLWFVRESRGWYKQHDWVIAHFGPGDDVLSEIPTLQGWMKQSYVAMAPKRLGRLVEGSSQTGV
ncbi:MmcQ/YjbR family DNA-binding protein [Phenylobacterium sp.]|uniref:MmcQ/YjbR family DNA-binding protein n=1 Tax=Phenylobacterium sp. TaxID=1871053 RepID=UPI002732D1B9|nr:MmcQ/YjbR family DNA-binding protein [Phenylobacterium sp.]MDP3852923.1 MmcQ/YjbR family DNA-binding protein [Phenylobacterium sp.]